MLTNKLGNKNFYQVFHEATRDDGRITKVMSIVLATNQDEAKLLATKHAAQDSPSINWNTAAITFFPVLILVEPEGEK